jgi:hypothetical protein
VILMAATKPSSLPNLPATIHSYETDLGDGWEDLR